MIIKKTAFCSNKTCCPTIEIDTEANTVTIVDDFEGKVTMDLEQWVSIRDQSFDAIAEALVAETEELGLYDNA